VAENPSTILLKGYIAQNKRISKQQWRSICWGNRGSCLGCFSQLLHCNWKLYQETP